MNKLLVAYIIILLTLCSCSREFSGSTATIPCMPEVARAVADSRVNEMRRTMGKHFWYQERKGGELVFVYGTEPDSVHTTVQGGNAIVYMSPETCKIRIVEIGK